MKLIVGLGNPDKKYLQNRHNIGFQIVDKIADNFQVKSFSKKFNGMFAKTVIDNVNVVLLKPQTYMNLSGTSVLSVATFFKIIPENMIVIHDDLDLPFARIKVKQGGGNGGHNGLKDIDKKVGKNYWRIRYGIDHPTHKNMVSDYVLSDFNRDEKEENSRMIEQMVENIQWILTDPPKFTNNLALSLK